jgi:hypothetical protein
MRILTSVLLTAALFILGAAGAPEAMAGDQAVGTWKQSSAENEIASIAIASVNIVEIDPSQNGIRLTLDRTDPGGSISRAEFIGRYDGKDYAVTGLPDADTISLKMIDAYTVTCLYKKAGKPVKMDRIVISEDGRKATVFQKGKDPNGMDAIVAYTWSKQ